MKSQICPLRGVSIVMKVLKIVIRVLSIVMKVKYCDESVDYVIRIRCGPYDIELTTVAQKVGKHCVEFLSKSTGRINLLLD